MGVTAQDVIKVMQSWIGKSRGLGTHKDIIDLYNSHKPLARGYKVSYTDAYCDTTVSAAFIKLNATSLIGGTECGVERHIQLFKAKGIWNENGNITPKPGYIICFNWDDPTQPNDGAADHIGIVEKVESGKITTIEGNYNGNVARRTIPVGWGYIRGYAAPKYDAIDEPIPKSETKGKNLNGIDIASYQGGLNTETIAADFIIVKATQGDSYINPYFKAQIDDAIKGGKIVGLYHYATGIGVDDEVDHFLDTVRAYIGKAFLCLDWETSKSGLGVNIQFHDPGYAKRFMDKVRERTGVTMFIYGSKDSCFNAMDWTDVKKSGYPCWGAQYRNYDTVNGYQTDPWQSARPWGAWGPDVSIFQYTSSLRLPGYYGDLDGDICYMTAEELRSYANETVIRYRPHVQTYGWLPSVANGVWAGSRGKSKRLEAFKITPPDGVELEVLVHIQKYGDRIYKGIRKGESSGEGSSPTDPIIGTVGESKRLEGFSIRCTKNTTGKKLYYQGHCQTYGDTKICKEGEFCGTRGQSKRLEAIRMWFE